MQKTVRLKNKHDHRIRNGHLWVFSNEIADSLQDFEPGETVTIVDSREKPLGSGMINPHSLIAIRLISRKAGTSIDQKWLNAKIKLAAEKRERWGFNKVYRLVHAESDGLPGLIIDRFEDVFVVQHNSAGMDKHAAEINQSLLKLFKAKTILYSNSSSVRKLEGLPESESIHGVPPPEIFWYENEGIWFPVDMKEGQKTRAYLDQAQNQFIVGELCNGKSVADLFSYTGNFGLVAAKHGASKVVLADRSTRALDIANEAFEKNKLPAPELFTGDLLKEKTSAKDAGGPFDVVISDPPPLIQNRAHLKAGTRKYEAVFSQAFEWLKPAGIAALFSCSHLATRDILQSTIIKAKNNAKCKVLLLNMLGAAYDHPVLPTHPETEYLHGAILEVNS
ncbi:class I SAM-dependent rRNA methyltransferase [bacterium]|nr:class I SAM-dependent rRNA methyltransferase [bacterium]